MNTEQQPRCWVLMRHQPTGDVWHAGWATPTTKGYRWERAPKLPPHPLHEYRNERQPASRIGNIR